MATAITATTLRQSTLSSPRGLLEGLKGGRLNSVSAYFLIWTSATLLAFITAGECQSIVNFSSLVYGITLWTWWGVFASLLWMTGKKVPTLNPFFPRTAVAHIAAAPILAYLHLLLLWSLVFRLPLTERVHWIDTEWQRLININRIGTEILIYGFIVGIIGTIQYQIRSQRDAIRASELQRQLTEAQLHALQMQMEPHFLFNTLNAITTLVELHRHEQAAQMLAHLNYILKATLSRTTPQKVSLAQELEVVENYLAIEQIRFADRLQIEFHVDQEALAGLVPSFLLQPIVENAIRHGIAYCEDQGVIEASVRRDGGTLRLRVCDTGSGGVKSTHSGNGIGLKNTRERLRHFYHDRFEMSAAAREAGGFEVAISIPYEQ